MPQTTSEGYKVAPLSEKSGRVEVVENTVGAMNGRDLYDPDEKEEYTTGDWFSYEVKEDTHPVGDGEYFHHIIDCSDVPDKHDTNLFDIVQNELMSRNLMVANVSFENDLIVVGHLDLVRRRMKLYHGETP